MNRAIASTRPLDAAPWATEGPFLFCVHHVDPLPAWQRPARPRGVARGARPGAGPVAGEAIGAKTAIGVRADAPAPLEAGDAECEVLLLQGRPIGEPVVQYGPFVMNTRDEIERTVAEYRRTRFRGWPWGDDAPVFPRDRGRFARHADGREERPDDEVTRSAP